MGDLLQPSHLLIVLVVALLLFGPKRLPELGRSLGRGLREFKDSVTGNDDHEDERGAPPPALPEASREPARAAPTPAGEPELRRPTAPDHTGASSTD